MFENLLAVQLPIIDRFFAIWDITPSMSKIVLLFAILGATLMSRVTDSVKIVFFPICIIFLASVTVVVNYFVQPAMGPAYTPFVKLLISASLGQACGACVLMAIFKTGDVRIQS